MILVVCFITSLSFLVVLDQNLVRLSYDISAKKKIIKNWLSQALI